nr:reverse transcriptase domain-containing protein [Tanacetum cinerariifolium]
MVTKLRNEITKFTQEPHESLFEAWERYKLSIDWCPNRNMLLVTQIDTFYNGLTLRHRDIINDTSAERGESTRSTTSSSPEIATLNKKIDDLSTVILRMSQSNPQVNVVNQSCKTCGGPHRYTKCPAIGGYTGVAYNGPTIPPTPLPKEVEQEQEVTKDKVQSTSSESTTHVQLPVVQVPIYELEVFPKPNPKPSIPYPAMLNNQKLREKANNQMLKFI